ncbi:MAG: glycoside hydrolase family 172 protein [Candidatus Bathyarchaeia archaeon]
MGSTGSGEVFAGLPMLRDFRRRRSSSHDETGGNRDYVVVQPGDEAVLVEMDGAGCVKHIWVTIRSEEVNYLRKLVLRMYWDGEEHPSVEVPIGDFFGIGHGLATNYISAPLQMSPEDGKGFNCWWPMPYSDSAKIEVENQGHMEVQSLYYYVDYEEYDRLQGDLGRFHAYWNRENPTQGIPKKGMRNDEWLFQGSNRDGTGNYVILEAEGRGHYVGCNMNIHNLRDTEDFNWYGEGDDMISVDGEQLPSIVGTGTEDYYGMSWCPTQRYCTPYHGLPLPGGENWSGRITWYRYHILDPISFHSSIKVTIEHGHANRRSDDYSSTAYWYQEEPHEHIGELIPVECRMPRD